MGGHVLTPPPAFRRRLLLRMRHGKNCGRMREDVRPAEVCFAALGSDLLKAPCHSKYGNAGGSAALASSAARGTRQQLKELAGLHSFNNLAKISGISKTARLLSRRVLQRNSASFPGCISCSTPLTISLKLCSTIPTFFSFTHSLL